MNLNAHLIALVLLSSDPVRDELARNSDKWFFWIVVSTCVVFVGAVFEGPEGVLELIDWIRARQQLKWVRSKEVISSSLDPARRTIAVSFLGMALVIFGIIGEGIFEFLSSDAESKIRAYDEDKLSTAESNAASANGKAGDAEERAAKLQKEAEDERLERVNLEKEIQPRTIDSRNRQEIADKLKKFTPSLKGRKVALSSIVGDAEAMLFSLQIRDILHRAEISVDDSGTGLMVEVGAMHTGVDITGPVKDQEFMKELAKNIHLFANLTEVRVAWDDTKYSGVGVMVDTKPVVELLPEPAKQKSAKAQQR